MKFTVAKLAECTSSCPEDAIVLLFKQRRIFLRSAEPVKFLSGLEVSGLEGLEYMNMGMLDKRQCFAAMIGEDMKVPENFCDMEFRDAIKLFDQGCFAAASRASQLLAWKTNHKFCSNCGTSTKQSPLETALVCIKCGAAHYPKICPAVIVAVLREDKILLAHNRNFRPGLYSTIAGFVEAGETLEDCIRREVLEEVGVNVRDIRYFSSQSWPFPNSLMLGFTAEYESGELHPDGDEITEADWFTSDKLPEIPAPGSISRSLIDDFVSKNKVK
jgi:NAD+ diphosphatase